MMRHTLAAFCMFAITLPGAAATQAEVIAIVDVNVVPMDDDTIDANQTVLIRDDTIVAIGPADLIRVPADAQRIDGTGRYLMPGLADMHVHLFSEDEFTLLLANGITTVRNMWGSAMHLDFQRRIDAGELRAPTMYTVGALVDGNPPIWPNSTMLEFPEQARAHVRQQAEEGFPAIKVYNRLEPDVYETIVETAAEVGLEVVGHVPNKVGLARVLECRQRTIEHLQGYVFASATRDFDPSKVEGTFFTIEFAAAQYFDEKRLDALVTETLRAGTWNCPTLVVFQQTTSDPAVERERPAARYVAPSTLTWWNTMQAVSPDRQPDIDAHQRVLFQIVKALHEAGCPLLLGTDMPNPWVVPGFAIHQELDLLVRAGLTPYEALRTGTINPAQYLEQEATFGTVHVGRRADLLLLESNPLDDVAHVQDRVGVMVRGDWISESELQSNLADIADRYTAQQVDDNPAADDLFADVNPLPQGEYTGRYSITLGTFDIGAERYCVQRNDDGSSTVTVQLAYRPPFATQIEIQQTCDANGSVTDLTIRGALNQNEMDLTATRNDATLTVSGTYGAQTIAEERTLADGVELATLSYALDAYRLSTTADAAPTTVQQLVVSYFPQFAILDATVTSSPGETATLDLLGETIDAQTYNVQTQMFGSATPSTVVLDQLGRMVGYRMNGPQGTFIVERVE